MNITSAKFIKGIVADDIVLHDGLPQVAFIGRSNVGKSSTINVLTKQKNLAITSSYPGRTQQINVFLINDSFYLMDLPGYGFAKVSKESKAKIFDLINFYLFNSKQNQKKVVLIVDALIGLTRDDFEMLEALEQYERDVVIVANKVDKIKKSEYKKQIQKIQESVGEHIIVPFSAEKKIGIEELLEIISA